MNEAHSSALRLTAAVQMASQLLLWVTFTGYDRAAQTVWQCALLLMLPALGLWLLWRFAGDGFHLLLLPCLLLDAVCLLHTLTGFIDGIIPEYPAMAGAAAVAAVCWLTLLSAGTHGVAYGTNVLRFMLPALFLLGTVFLRASSRADRLWPLLGQGLAHTARTALSGTGAVWGAALVFVLPQEKGKTLPWVLAAWAVGAVWALWYGFLRPWSPGDLLSTAERLMGLARHAQSILSYELAGLMWLVLLPVSLTCCAMSGEVLLSRAFPRWPRAVPASVILLPAFLIVWLFSPRLPQALALLLPWRSVLCAAAGLASLIRKKVRP